MTVSFNARHLALFTDSGYLWLGSTDLRTKYCEVETDTILRPKQLTWYVQIVNYVIVMR